MEVFKVDVSKKNIVNVVGGIESKFLDALIAALQVSYKILMPGDGEWGRRLEDGNWTGLIGMISRNETDIAMGKVAISYDRSTASDFTYPYSIERVTFATKPPGLKSKETAVFTPFTLNTWLAVLCTLVCVILASKFLLCHNYRLGRLITYFFSSILLISLNLKIYKMHEKVFLCVWLISSMVLSYSYMGMLLSSLTVPKREPPVSNKYELLDVLNKGKFKCVTIKGSFIPNALLTSEDETVLSIGKYISKNEWLIQGTNDKVSRNLRKDYTAVIAPENTFTILFPNQYFLAKDSFSLIYWGIAVREDFCCKKDINRAIHRIVAAGLYDKIHKDYYFKFQLKHGATMQLETEKKLSLKLQDVSAAFIVLLSGYILSFLALCLEIMITKFKLKKYIYLFKRKQNKNLLQRQKKSGIVVKIF